MEMMTLALLHGELVSVEAQLRQFSNVLNREVGGKPDVALLKQQVSLQGTALEAQGKLLAYYGGVLHAFSDRLDKMESVK